MNFLSLIRLLRPHQWLKNLMLFFPPFLGGKIAELTFFQTFTPLAAFCLASSSTYIINDIIDFSSDALHPKKKIRPIASGVITNRVAFAIALVLGVGSISLAMQVGLVFLSILSTYVILSLAYTFKLKQVALVDIFCISIFFFFFLTAGGQAFHVHVSDWLFLSVFLLAVFLSTGKRLCERNCLGDMADIHRVALKDYPEGLLDGIMYMTGGAVLVTYTLYVISRHGMVYTVPLCCFGLMRYMYRVKIGRGGDPTYALLQDPVLFAVGAMWTVMVGFGIYFGN